MKLTKNSALQFIVLMGIVSLFADFTYEAARSITGQYLALLGATGTIVGIVAGFGEFVGYSFRLISGYFSDKTGRYWLMTFLGYAINLFAVPLLALAGNWPLAASLMILERFGKALQKPSKDALLSYAASQTGTGWGFGLHEALDQVGAILGPLLVSVILYFKGSYELSFGILLIPALCALIVLAFAKWLYPQPQDLEKKPVHQEGLTKNYWLYMGGICCVAAGYVDFPLIAYHFKTGSIMSDSWIPILFSIAMGISAFSALVCGWLYDKKGISVLYVSIGLAALAAPFVFRDGFYLALFGMILWGIGLGAQESVMRAIVAQLIQKNKRGTAFGTMHFCFGLAWFLGSAWMGFLYDVSLVSLMIFSSGFQLLAIPLLTFVHLDNGNSR